MSNRVRIVEATIRDGGYMTDHHFSKSDLATLVGGLDRSGLPYIEVGHGSGVGCHIWKDEKRRANLMPLPQVGDAAHAEVCLRVAKQAKLGVLMVAGRRHTPIEYIDDVAAMGFSFIRLASMPDEVNDELFAYVRRIKDRGLIASINMMQTYVQPPELVGELAARAADHGLDWFYVVDSAGGMRPDEVKRYVTSILSKARVEVGLHAHNNLGCAVANSLAAVDVGATLVDGTLNGIGRATGNAATEQLAVALRHQLAHEVELDTVCALGNAIRSLFDDAGNDSLDFISGGAQVHSRNVKKTEEAARARDRSRTSFLIAVGDEAKRRGELNATTFSEALYDAAAALAAPVRRSEPTDAMVAVATDEIVAKWNGGPRRAIEDLSLRSRQRHRTSVVHISRGAAALTLQPVPWEHGVMGVTVPWTGDATAWEIAQEHRPDFVIFDGDGALPLAGKHAAMQISFADVHARAVQDLAMALQHGGATLWSPDGDDRSLGMLPRATGAHPAGAAAVVLGTDARVDAKLVAGDVAIVAGAPSRSRVDNLRRRGVRVVSAKWASTVADLAQTLIALHGDLAAGEPDKLAAGVQACGTGQSAWDPQHAALLDAEDPAAAAKQAGVVFVSSILAGTRRL